MPGTRTTKGIRSSIALIKGSRRLWKALEGSGSLSAAELSMSKSWEREVRSLFFGHLRCAGGNKEQFGD